MVVNCKKIVIVVLNFLGEKIIFFLMKYKMYKSERECRVLWVKFVVCLIIFFFFLVDFVDLLLFNIFKFFFGEVDFNEN